eukprot:403331602
MNYQENALNTQNYHKERQNLSRSSMRSKYGSMGAGKGDFNMSQQSMEKKQELISAISSMDEAQLSKSYIQIKNIILESSNKNTVNLDQQTQLDLHSQFNDDISMKSYVNSTKAQSNGILSQLTANTQSNQRYIDLEKQIQQDKDKYETMIIELQKRNDDLQKALQNIVFQDKSHKKQIK